MRGPVLGLVFLVAVAAANASDAAEPASKQAPAIARIDTALNDITTISRPGRIGYATIHDGDKYVQCRRLADGAMRCEAAGSAMQPSLAAVLTPAHTRALAALGWRPDPAFGNFVRAFPADMPTKEIAAHIVRTLADAYRSDPEDLERATAWVEDVPCPPRNAAGQSLAGLVNDDPTMRRIRTCTS
ncbi:MAG: TY-Chap domain-containing protein, partial [Pseudolabrys sp.]